MTDAALPSPLFTATVQEDWIDYNGHMNDASYARVFSLSVDALMAAIGLDQYGRERTSLTIYTLTMTIHYLREVHAGEALTVEGRILEHDDKRIRLWLELIRGDGAVSALNEQVLLCVDQSGENPARPPSRPTRSPASARSTQRRPTCPFPRKPGAESVCKGGDRKAGRGQTINVLRAIDVPDGRRLDCAHAQLGEPLSRDIHDGVGSPRHCHEDFGDWTRQADEAVAAVLGGKKDGARAAGEGAGAGGQQTGVDRRTIRPHQQQGTFGRLENRQHPGAEIAVWLGAQRHAEILFAGDEESVARIRRAPQRRRQAGLHDPAERRAHERGVKARGAGRAEARDQTRLRMARLGRARHEGERDFNRIWAHIHSDARDRQGPRRRNRPAAGATSTARFARSPCRPTAVPRS